MGRVEVWEELEKRRMGNCGQDGKLKTINRKYKTYFQENYMGFWTARLFIVITIMKLSIKIIKYITETISNRKPWRSVNSEYHMRRNCVPVEAFLSTLISVSFSM